MYLLFEHFKNVNNINIYFRLAPILRFHLTSAIKIGCTGNALLFKVTINTATLAELHGPGLEEFSA